MCCHCGHTAARPGTARRTTPAARRDGFFVPLRLNVSCCYNAIHFRRCSRKPWERGKKQGEKAENADLASARRYQKLLEQDGNKWGANWEQSRK